MAFVRVYDLGFYLFQQFRRYFVAAVTVGIVLVHVLLLFASLCIVTIVCMHAALNPPFRSLGFAGEWEQCRQPARTAREGM